MAKNIFQRKLDSFPTEKCTSKCFDNLELATWKLIWTKHVLYNQQNAFWDGKIYLYHPIVHWHKGREVQF